MHVRQRLAFAPLLVWGGAIYSNALRIQPPINAPSTAKPLHPGLVSFSLEQDRWTDWVGLEEPNQFFLNVLENLRVRTGVPSYIRVGANTEDRTNFDFGTEFSSAVYPEYTSVIPYPEASRVVVGDGYYQLSSRLLPGTHVTWGLNLGANNATAVYLVAQSILKAFESPEIKSKGILLDFLEIGNEPDWYRFNGLRSSSYSPADYTSEWVKFATNVTEAFGLAERERPKWLGASFLASSHDTSSFSPQAWVATGILETLPGSLITTFSQHHYSGAYCEGDAFLLQDLMYKANIHGNISQYIQDVDFVKAQGLDYVGGEMNSIACHGAPGVSNTAGAALWTLDYTLFAASGGLSQIFFHEGIGFKYNLIQPITLTRSPVDGTPLETPLPPHVQPQYYSGILINEAIGTSGESSIVSLAINDEWISGFAIYERGAISRIVLLNSKAWVAADEGVRSRTRTHVDLSFGDSALSRARAQVKRLAIRYADDLTGLNWAGVSFETVDGLPSGQETVETIRVRDGVDIQETEAVLITLLS